MTHLRDMRCRDCAKTDEPLAAARLALLQQQLHPDWHLVNEGRALQRRLQFQDFYRVMSFVNALAHMANVEDHHPDLELGYGYCNVRFSTHDAGGLTDRDFICAARTDALL